MYNFMDPYTNILFDYHTYILSFFDAKIVSNPFVEDCQANELKVDFAINFKTF